MHTHACGVEDFRRKLAKGGHNVVFVVTTVPRKRPGARNRDGTSYFSAHLNSMLSQEVPVIYVQGDPKEDEVGRLLYKLNPVDT